MEHFFRITVCLILFSAYLQARPIDFSDVDLSFAQKVSCERNMTFTSPSNVQKHCCTAAFRVTMEQLNQARDNCTDETDQISDALESLEFYSRKCPPSVERNSSNCKWETEKDQKTLAEFVGNIESLLQLLNVMLLT